MYCVKMVCDRQESVATVQVFFLSDVSPFYTHMYMLYPIKNFLHRFTAQTKSINSSLLEWYLDSASDNFLLMQHTIIRGSFSSLLCSIMAPKPIELASVCTSVTADLELNILITGAFSNAVFNTRNASSCSEFHEYSTPFLVSLVSGSAIVA